MLHSKYAHVALCNFFCPLNVNLIDLFNREMISLQLNDVSKHMLNLQKLNSTMMLVKVSKYVGKVKNVYCFFDIDALDVNV